MTHLDITARSLSDSSHEEPDIVIEGGILITMVDGEDPMTPARVFPSNTSDCLAGFKHLTVFMEVIRVCYYSGTWVLIGNPIYREAICIWQSIATEH